MSVKTFAYGDTGIYIFADIANVDGSEIGGSITAATLEFTGPQGQTFEVEASLVDDLRVGYLLASDSYSSTRFDVRGLWNAKGRFTLTGGRSLGSLECVAFTIR